MSRWPRYLRSAVNKTFKLCLGNGTRPVFFDVDAVCPPLRELERHTDAIRGELAPFLADRSKLMLYHEFDPRQGHISEGDQDWRVLYGHPNRPHFPVTCGLLDQVPDLLGAFFSVLEPGKSVPAHSGPYLGYLRYHLALHVPEHNPPILRIGTHDYTWRTDESVMFDDSHRHEVINESDEVRVVLVVDVLRPMAAPLDWINRRTVWTTMAS